MYYLYFISQNVCIAQGRVRLYIPNFATLQTSHTHTQTHTNSVKFRGKCVSEWGVGAFGTKCSRFRLALTSNRF